MQVVRSNTPQHTLSRSVERTGVGLFTGAQTRMRLLPGEEDRGIVFRRVDLSGAPEIPARVDHVDAARPRRTVLASGDASVETVEHCLSALAALGIDNAVVEVNGPEIPAFDGSALPIVEAIHDAGIDAQTAPREVVVIDEPIVVRDGEAVVSALPIEGDTPEYVYMLDYGEGSPIARQSKAVSLDAASFETEVAPARTFSTRREAEFARSNGLFTHLEPKDMLVIDDAGPIDNAYRFDDEPARHKLLDLIGDLALVGKPLRGRFVSARSGHTLNHKLASAIFKAAEGIEARPGSPTAPAEPEKPAMEIRQIMRLLPHRYPMVLIDRVLEVEADQRAVGIKNVTINEPFFQGHYPHTPIMPGVLIVEAMCQLAGLMLSRKLERTGKIAVLMTLDDVRLRKAVTPGDQLVIESEALRTSPRFGDCACRAFVAGNLVAEARVKFMMVDAEKQP